MLPHISSTTTKQHSSSTNCERHNYLTMSDLTEERSRRSACGTAGTDTRRTRSIFMCQDLVSGSAGRWGRSGVRERLEALQAKMAQGGSTLVPPHCTQWCWHSTAHQPNVFYHSELIHTTECDTRERESCWQAGDILPAVYDRRWCTVHSTLPIFTIKTPNQPKI